MSEKKYILAHDMGTSSDKAVLVDFAGNIAATSSAPYPTFYPNPAWVEQDPQDYWEAVALTSRTIVRENGINPSEIKGIVFSTQAQGIIPVDEEEYLRIKELVERGEYQCTVHEGEV